jgi:hypothetical protein
MNALDGKHMDRSNSLLVLLQRLKERLVAVAVVQSLDSNREGQQEEERWRKELKSLTASEVVTEHAEPAERKGHAHTIGCLNA